MIQFAKSVSCEAMQSDLMPVARLSAALAQSCPRCCRRRDASGRHENFSNKLSAICNETNQYKSARNCIADFKQAAV